MLGMSISAPAGCLVPAAEPDTKWPGLSAERQCLLDRNAHRSLCISPSAGPEYMFKQAYPPKDRSQAPLFGRCGYTGQQPALRKICKREGVVLGIHLLAIRCNRLVSHASHASHASGLCSHVTGSITCADQPQLLAVLLHKLPQSDGCTAANACGTPSGWESHTG